MKSLAVSNIVQTKSIFQASMYLSEAVARRCSVEKVYCKIPQNSQENTCSRVSFFNKVNKLYQKRDSGCEFCEISKNKTCDEMRADSQFLLKTNWWHNSESLTCDIFQGNDQQVDIVLFSVYSIATKYFKFCEVSFFAYQKLMTSSNH